MKKNILSLAALFSLGMIQAQIQTNGGTNNSITNSNVLIDGSTSYSKEAGAQPNVGKGIIIPSVDLIKFEFDLSLADGTTFPTYFDGMIVYNNATGTTLTNGNRPSTATAVIPGYYYFSNPNGANNGNVTGGKWLPLGSTVAGDNLGNHSATQNLALNGYELRLKGGGDTNQSLVYNPTVDGPRLFGAGGGYLGTANSKNALQWDNNGNLGVPTSNAVLKFANSTGNRKIVLWEDVANDNQYYGFGINGGILRYQTSSVAADHVFYAGASATASNELLRVSGNGNTLAAGEVYSGINRWFRVRGVNSGIYWENQGGGWWMNDTNWLRVYNNKSILANNVIRTGDGVGYAQLNPGSASNTGQLAIHKTDGTRLGYIGWDNTNLTYITENGANHVFGGVGNLIAENEVYSGVNKWFRVRGVNSGIYWENQGGGWWMNDTNWLRVYNNKSILANNVIRTGDGVGYAQLNPGSASNTGHLAIHRTDGTRLGYIGWDNTNLTYITENGANHVFGGVGSVIAENEVYSGVNKWFRVRGVNSGIYWENQGGGWWMNDTSWLRVYNGKSIMANNVIRTGDGVGFAQMVPGGASNTGYFAVHRKDGTRLGYMGFDNTNLTYVAENGAVHNFVGGNVVVETELYSGVNKWFRVRGNTGIYWENYGGGWYMSDGDWLRTYNNKGVAAGQGYFTGTVYTPRVQGTSDKRFKKDIVPIYNATEKLNQLNGYTYTWRDKKDFPDQALGEGKDIGVIAQEVENVFPEAVMTNEKGYKSVNYNALIPVLIEALKESNRKIATLENRLDAILKPTATEKKQNFPEINKKMPVSSTVNP